jgi:hypothetical protein
VIADTINAGTIYLTDKPDWAEAYSFDKEFVTLVTKSKNAAEQRAKMRSKSRHVLSYAITAMTIAEASVRRSQAIVGMGKNVAAPIWHAWEDVTGIVGNVASVGHALLELRPFAVGGLAYFEQTGFTSVFRRITAVAAGSITLQAGNAESPNIAVPAFTTPRMYPVIIGIFDENSVRFMQADLNRTTQLVNLAEL